MERSKVDTKKSPDGLSHPNQNTTIINIILQYFIRHGKIKIKLHFKKMHFNNGKIKTIHPPHPEVLKIKNHPEVLKGYSYYNIGNES